MEISPVLSGAEVLKLMGLLRDAKRIVVTGHRGPDGDAAGSSLAWADYLRRIGKQVSVVLPNPFPDFLRWLPGSSNILFYSEEETREAAAKAIREADLICLLDFNALHRLQDLAPLVEKSSARRFMIDHHEGPDLSCADFILSRTEACSTCELVFRLIYQLGGFDKMSRGAAACIYCGMMTDTGGFSYASNRPEIFIIIAHLLTKGIDKDQIHRHVNNSWSENRLRFWSYMLSEKLTFYKSRRASILTTTREDMKRFRFIRGDAEGLVNEPLKVRGMRLSISLREDTEREIIRISVRSIEDFPANKLAEDFFNGGGHFNAAGGELPFPLEEAIKTAEKAIEAYSEYL